MKIKVPSFEMLDMDDNSYPMYVHTPLYSKADVEVTMSIYKQELYNSWVNSHWHDARMWNDNKAVPIFKHNDTGLVIENEKFFDRISIQIHIYPTEGKVVILNTRTGKCGIAKCHSEECFSESVGIAIAWARYCNEKIPDYVLKCLEER